MHGEGPLLWISGLALRVAAGVFAAVETIPVFGIGGGGDPKCDVWNA